MSKTYTIHLIACASTLLSATAMIEADTPDEAKAKLTTGLQDGSIHPTWDTATNSIELKDYTEKAYIHGVDEPDEIKDATTGKTPLNSTSSENDGTGASSGVQGGLFVDRDKEIVTGEKRSLVGGIAPAKSAPRAEPIPTPAAGASLDPTKSPTPGADGTTHVPLGQRSQAVGGLRTLTGRDDPNNRSTLTTTEDSPGTSTTAGKDFGPGRVLQEHEIAQDHEHAAV